jgi:hypothetical protein
MTATRPGDERVSRRIVVEEPSKNVWYLLLLTLSIGG